MTLEQQALQTKRLSLEEQLFNVQKSLWGINDACTDHVIIKGRMIFSPRQGKVVNTHDGLPYDWNNYCYSVSCAICGKDFGWHCPVNPKEYCEYENHSELCIHCGIPEERK